MPNPDEPQNITLPKPCWACGAVISPEDNYCRNCGKGQGGRVPWHYTHWGIIVLTLVGLGPFSLFYVWRSPVISRGAKLAYSAGIILLTLFIVDRFYRVWQSFQSLLGGAQLY